MPTNWKKCKISAFPLLGPSMLIKSKRHNDLQSLYGTMVKPFYLGRSAVWQGIRLLRLSNHDNILMPAYHCSVEVEAVYKAHSNIRFYKITRDMNVDIADLESRIDRQTKAIFIIHYFGFPQQIDRILGLCKKYNLFLIEDAAHAFLSAIDNKYLGTFGDLGILSIRKTLPIPDGGALIVNSSKLKIENIKLIKPNSISVLRVVILKFLKFYEVKHSHIYGIVRKILINPLTSAKKRIHPRSIKIMNPNSLEFDEKIAQMTISGSAKRIVNNIDFKEIVKKRIINYNYLLELLKDIREVKGVFNSIPIGICPCFYPIMVSNRDKIQKELLTLGVETFIFGKDLHPILNKDEYKDACYLSDNVLALPIHQDLGEKEIIYLGRLVKEVVKQS